MRKSIWGILFMLPFAVLAVWTLCLTYQRNTGREVKVAVEGYDPRDLLSGHYIQYQIDWEKTDCTQFINGICPQDDFCKEARWGKQCRYYVPENFAADLDDLFRRFRSGDESLTFEVVYAYQPNRQAIAKRLLINGEDWRNAMVKDK